MRTTTFHAHDFAPRHPEGSPLAGPISVGRHTDGRVAVLLAPPAAEVLARIIARFDDYDALQAELDSDPQLAEFRVWAHVVVDLLASKAHGAASPAPTNVVRMSIPAGTTPADVAAALARHKSPAPGLRGEAQPGAGNIGRTAR